MVQSSLGPQGWNNADTTTTIRGCSTFLPDQTILGRGSLFIPTGSNENGCRSRDVNQMHSKNQKHRNPLKKIEESRRPESRRESSLSGAVDDLTTVVERIKGRSPPLRPDPTAERNFSRRLTTPRGSLNGKSWVADDNECETKGDKDLRVVDRTV